VSINTYKHEWRVCLDCGVMRRERKSCYLASRIPGLGKLLRSPLYRRVLLEDPDVRDRESVFYDYYRDLCALGPNGTKWEGEKRS
jgi:hypothetical protein